MARPAGGCRRPHLDLIHREAELRHHAVCVAHAGRTEVDGELGHGLPTDTHQAQRAEGGSHGGGGGRRGRERGRGRHWGGGGGGRGRHRGRARHREAGSSQGAGR